MQVRQAQPVAHNPPPLNQRLQRPQHRRRTCQAFPDLGCIRRSRRAKHRMRKHLPHHWPVTITVDDRDHLLHPPLRLRVLRHQPHPGKCRVDISSDRRSFVDHEPIVPQRRHPPKRMQSQVPGRHLGKRIHLQMLERNALFQQHQPRNPEINTVVIANQFNTHAALPIHCRAASGRCASPRLTPHRHRAQLPSSPNRAPYVPHPH